MSFEDHFTKFTLLFPIPNKLDVMKIFFSFQKFVECQFICKIKSVQTDWGTEFWSLHTYFANISIQDRITCPPASQQNGSIVWKHHHIVGTVLSLLSHSSVLHAYWDDAFLTTTYLINQLSTSPLGVSLFEKLNKHTLDFPSLKILGCACFPYLHSFNRHKIDCMSK